jgi:hypothetical protein
VVVADQLAQILRVMPGRERRRADQVAEHHGQLSAFGLGGSRCIGWHRRHDGGGSRAGGRRGTKRGNGVEQLAPVADRGHANANQVVGSQLPQYLGVDIVIAEGRRIALEAQILQPRRYVHAVFFGFEERQPLVNEDIPLPFGLPAVEQ